MSELTFPNKFVWALVFGVLLAVFAVSRAVPLAAQGSLPVCRVHGTIEQNTTWTPDCLYLVDGYLTVHRDVTLTIQAGTIVKVLPNKLIDT
jgi:hypothetical protein